MSIEVICTVCETRHSVHARMAGREVRCPTCDEVVVVPAAKVAPPVEAVVDPVPPAADPIVRSALPVAAVVAVDPPLRGDLLVSRSSSVPASASADAFDEDYNDEFTHEDFIHDDEDDDFAGMFKRHQLEDEELDMTPMVDVTFLLLIFFMVTASFSLQKSIEMPRQTSELPSPTTDNEIIDELDTVELKIDEFGAFMVISPDWERETPGKQNLINTLREAIAERRDGMKLSIKIHEMAKLQALVDGMDSGTIAGYTDIKVTQVDGFD